MRSAMNVQDGLPPKDPRVTSEAVAEVDEKGEYTDVDPDLDPVSADPDSISDSNGPAKPGDGAEEGEYTDSDEPD
jgi:hypothetical protein